MNSTTFRLEYVDILLTGSVFVGNEVTIASGQSVLRSA